MKTLSLVLKVGLLILLIFATGYYAEAQMWGVSGSGNVISQERSVTDFSTVKVQGSADVILKQGDKISVVVQADDNLIANIITKVKGDALIIETEGNIRNSKKFEVFVTVPRLDGIEINGSGDVDSDGKISGNALSVSINGSGDVELDLDYKSLRANVNGSGDIDISGITGDLDLGIMGSGDFEASGLRLNLCKISVFGSGDIKLSGSAATVIVELSASGDVNLFNLTAESVDVRSNGSGDVVVNVNNSLKASLSGSGDLTYSGSPGQVDVIANGSGSVYKR